MFRSLNFSSIVALLMIGLLSLAGCDPVIIPASDSAELATLVGVQPSVQKPTRTSKSATPAATSAKRVKNIPGDFDFYVMSLSWSPDYCASNDDPQQCSVGKKLGFVLHGLWPQYNRGYPADCSSAKLPKDAQQKFPNLYPSSSLFTHEWNKHGTCSGLSPVDYLTLTKTLKESIVIPQAYRNPVKAFRTTVADLKTAFIKANSTLSEDALAVQCSGSGRFLKELYVCFARDGQPIACSAELQKDEAKSCGNADFLVRNVK